MKKKILVIVCLLVIIIAAIASVNIKSTAGYYQIDSATLKEQTSAVSKALDDAVAGKNDSDTKTAAKTKTEDKTKDKTTAKASDETKSSAAAAAKDKTTVSVKTTPKTTTKDKAKTTTTAPKNNTIKVTISIDTLNLIKAPGKNKVAANKKSLVPKNGYLLGDISLEVNKNATVYNALVKATKTYGIQMEYSGSGSNIYIQGIGNIYEFDAGAESGWMYSVNGTFPNYGVGNYQLKNGDKVRFRYTVDLGKDVGRGF